MRTYSCRQEGRLILRDFSNANLKDEENAAVRRLRRIAFPAEGNSIFKRQPVIHRVSYSGGAFM